MSACACLYAECREAGRCLARAKSGQEPFSVTVALDAALQLALQLGEKIDAMDAALEKANGAGAEP